MILDLPPGALLDKTQLIARAARAQGGCALLVGGYVRDALLGLDPKDADVEVYGIQSDDLLKILRKFGRVNCVGESFQVLKLAWNEKGERHELDVSIPRRDVKTGDGHRGFSVEGDPHSSIEDAARRRDFTINAILCDPLTGEILDPFNGRADLENKILRIVDAKHFAEDSLRVLRAMQFAARLELTIDPATIELCRSIDLSDLPRERIWGEWEKMLMKSRPSFGLRYARALGILEKLFPYLEAALAREERITCNVIDAAAAERDRWPIEGKLAREPLSVERHLALILAAIGVFCQDGEVDLFLDALNVHTLNSYELRSNVLHLIAEKNTLATLWMRSQNLDFPRDGEIRRLANRVEPRLLWHLTRALGERRAAAWFLHEARRLDVWNGPPSPLLLGRHLLKIGLKPGPQIGEITRAVYEMQLDGTVANLDEARVAAQNFISE